MAQIKSFKGITYNPEKIKIENVIAPPYDVINQEEQNYYYDCDPKNVIRLILGREDDRYSEAKENFNNWINEKILIENEEGIFPLVQSFKSIDGKIINRKGFIALVKLEEFDKGIILPHEKTLSKAKEDRLKLLRATNANFSQIFGLYSDKEKNIDNLISYEENPFFDLNFQNVRNRIWKLTDKKIIEKISEIIKEKQILIADGHHRYETALNYRNEMRKKNPNFIGDEKFNFVMMFLTNLDDDGLVIFPTHRVAHSLKSFDFSTFYEKLKTNFTITEISDSKNLSNFELQKYSFGMICGKPTKNFVITLKDENLINNLLDENLPSEVKDLDVVLLHNYILKELLYISEEAQEKKTNIFYLQNISDCKNMIENETANIAFIVSPTKIEQVRRISRAGFVMPQKSTFFYPKLVSGLIFNLLD